MGRRAIHFRHPLTGVRIVMHQSRSSLRSLRALILRAFGANLAGAARIPGVSRARIGAVSDRLLAPEAELRQITSFPSWSVGRRADLEELAGPIA